MNIDEWLIENEFTNDKWALTNGSLKTNLQMTNEHLQMAHWKRIYKWQMSIDKWFIENKFTSRELLNCVAVSIDKWLTTQVSY